MNPALLSSDLEHWLTPPSFLDLVVAALGGIDLDPCSNRAAVVPANSSCYVGEADGLLSPWFGRIFVNPPYGDKIPLWCKRMHMVARQLRTSLAMIGLLPARVDTAWCQRYILESCDAWVMWSGRITFWRAWTDEEIHALRRAIFRLPPVFRQSSSSIWIGPTLDLKGNPQPAPFPSLIPYWGPDVLQFGRTFRPYGTLVITRGEKAGVYARKAA